jgi:hypothetical protein
MLKKLFLKKPEPVASPFAEFIRHARSADKKHVYTVVLKKAIQEQASVYSSTYQIQDKITGVTVRRADARPAGVIRKPAQH